MNSKRVIVLAVIIMLGLYFVSFPVYVVGRVHDNLSMGLTCVVWYSDAFPFGRGVSCGTDSQSSNGFIQPLPPGVFEIVLWLLGLH